MKFEIFEGTIKETEDYLNELSESNSVSIVSQMPICYIKQPSSSCCDDVKHGSEIFVNSILTTVELTPLNKTES